MKTTLYSSDDIRNIVARVGLDRLMDDCIAGINDACLNSRKADYVVPARAGFDYTHPGVGLIEWMPAMETGVSATVKMVGYHPGNPETRKLPTILSTVLNFSTDSGHLISIMDGTFLTALRTGAASAVASRLLAPAGARVVGLIGAGAQAVTQLHALSRVFNIDEVLVFDTHKQALQSFETRIRRLGLTSLRVTRASPEQITATSHILCTATSVPAGHGPVFSDAIVRPSLHINAVGSDFPGKTEIPKTLLARSLVVPDFRDQALVEGECQQLEPHQVGPDLATLIRDPGRFADAVQRTTVFDSTGWALEDHVAMNVDSRSRTNAWHRFRHSAGKHCQ